MKMASVVTSMLLLITLSVIVSAEKPGSCPPMGPVGTCAITCEDDNECRGNKKCCGTACGGTVCLAPVTSPANVVKQGACPARPTGRWTCSSTCRTDGDCRGNKKCCKNRCGALACQNPVFDNSEENDYAVPAVIVRDNES